MTFTNSKLSPVEFNPDQHQFCFDGADIKIYLECGSESLAVARLRSNPDHAVWVSIKQIKLEDTLGLSVESPALSEALTVAGCSTADWKLDENGVPTLTKEESYRLKRRTLRSVARKVRNATTRRKLKKGKKRPGRKAFKPQSTD